MTLEQLVCIGLGIILGFLLAMFKQWCSRFIKLHRRKYQDYRRYSYFR